jgi:hypothetical protein
MRPPFLASPQWIAEPGPCGDSRWSVVGTFRATAGVEDAHRPYGIVVVAFYVVVQGGRVPAWQDGTYTQML